MKHIGVAMVGILFALGAASSASCGGTAGTSASSSSSSSSSGGGGGGGAPTCVTLGCPGPGEVCLGGSCVVDCRRPGANPCAAGKVCDVSAASPGECVDPASPCVTTSLPETCGSRVCGPGSACAGNDKCYPRVPCSAVLCEGDTCWGEGCACDRAIGCSPAPLGTPAGGEAGSLHDPLFRHGLVDLEFSPDCTAWGVTLISGPDYLRSMSPMGMPSSYQGVTNLNMGEVSVLQQITVPKSGDWPPPPLPPEPPKDLDVAATYICCAQCGCMLQTTPQGVARFDPMTSMLPLVIPSQTFTTGNGPFGGPAIDTGPAGLSYGTDRVLYVGNIDTNGDYYKLDLATNAQTLVTNFPARVHASTPFDAITMLVALENGEIRALRITDATSAVWATSDSPVTGMVRDFFDGSVYVARRDLTIVRYDAAGVSEPFQTTTYAARVTIAPDGYLYVLEIPANYADKTPIVTRHALPLMR